MNMSLEGLTVGRKNDLFVTVKGTSGSEKTGVAHLLATLLTLHGVDVEYIDTVDDRVNSFHDLDISSVLNSLRDRKARVVITETQLR